MSVAQQIDRLRKHADGSPRFPDEQALIEWRSHARTLLRVTLGAGHPLLLEYDDVNPQRRRVVINSSRVEYPEANFDRVVNEVAAILRSAILELEIHEQDLAEMQSSSPSAQAIGDGIFVVHGHNDAYRHEVVRFIEQATQVSPTVLMDRPDSGRTIIEKLEGEAASAGFAIVIATSDDLGKAKTAENLSERARQNVYLEWGYFVGRLGRSRVTFLYESGVEIPSDMAGLVYIELDKSGGWKLRLAKELRSAGITTSLDRTLLA